MPATRSRGVKRTDTQKTHKVQDATTAAFSREEKDVSPKSDEVDGPIPLDTKTASGLRPKRSLSKVEKSVDIKQDRTETEETSRQDRIVPVLEKNTSAKVLPKKRKSDLNEQFTSPQKRPNRTQKTVKGTTDLEPGVCMDKGHSKSHRPVSEKQTQKEKLTSSDSTVSRSERGKSASRVRALPSNSDRKTSEKKLPISNKDENLEGLLDRSKAGSFAENSVIIKTEDSSSSDSDFEEVEAHFRTPETSHLSSICSDSGIGQKLQDSFSDLEHTQGPSANEASHAKTSSDSKTLCAPKSDPFGSGCGKSASQASVKDKKSSKENTAVAISKTSGRKGGKQQHEDKAAKSTKTKKQGRARKSAPLESPKKEISLDPGKDDIMAMLMQMEGQPVKLQHTEVNQPSTSGQPASSKKARKRKSQKADSDSSDESDWEEVEDYNHNPVQSQVPDGPVQITIDDPNMMHKKRKKKEFDWKAYVQRKINRLAREIQVDMHKVSLLCLVAHGMQQNAMCSDATVCATALSMVPMNQLKKDTAFYDADSVMFLLKWFRSTFSLVKDPTDEKLPLVSSSHLVGVIRDTTTNEARVLVMVLVAILRALGFNVRLVMSLQPVPLKSSQVATSKLASKLKGTKKAKKKSASSQKSKEPQKANTAAVSKQPSKSAKPTKTAGQQVRKRKLTSKKKDEEDTSSSDDDGSVDGPSQSKRRASARAKKHVQSAKRSKDASEERSVSDLEVSSASDASNFSDEEEIIQRKKKSKKGKNSAKKTSKGKFAENEDSSSEFDHSFSVKSPTASQGELKKDNRKILSSDDSPEGSQKSKGRDVWLEVYLPRTSTWLSVDCIRCTVGKSYEVGDAASKPLLYVLGFENDGSVKDITAKYTPQWLSHTRKRRVDSDWWRESLEPYASANVELDDQENQAIKDHLVKRPLPTNIGDFKNHPLYALRRHLLKYEAIYPESSIPLGYIRNEPVYARECVHTLHSRDNWLREARLVRIGETAYKRVKSRKRWNRMGDRPAEELDLELFGFWQTEDYIPPPAVNGKVPKNEYGNVELFQPSMLPGGTVHLRVPALNRVAKKLGIDVAAAMTGWDHHCGYSHPVLDGWVVCEEHKEVLLAAWEEDQEIQRQREEERREKRVLGNWTTLVRGLLVKEKLKKKFNLEEKKPEPKVKKEAKSKKGEKATDVQHAWPAKQQQQELQKKKPVPQPTHYTVETM